MKPLQFNYPPDVAVSFVEHMVKNTKTDPQATSEQRAVIEDVQTLVKFAQSQLRPVPGNNEN